MRRRRDDEWAPTPPPELLTFVPGRWPGDDDARRWESFRAARLAHLERHGWPGGSHAEIVSLPDQPFAGWMI